MPARCEEIRHAHEEGIEFVMLTAPTALRGTQDGWVSALSCQRMELGEPDNSGRRSSRPITGSDFELPVGVLINAVGSGANPLLTASAPELSCNSRGNILINSTGETSIAGVFAGGDIVRGGATVILAMGDGKRAASAINEYLNTIVVRKRGQYL